MTRHSLLCRGIRACVAVVLAHASFAATNAPDPTPGVVQILVATQRHNPLFPWQKSAPRTHFGYGYDLGGGRVLTTEHLVRNHTLVELRRARTGLKRPMTVSIADPQVNLALLERLHPPVTDRTPLPRLAAELDRHAVLTILQLNETHQIQRGEARVLHVNMSRLPSTTVYSSLSFTLLTDLNVDGEGAPVLHNEALAGLMLSYDKSKRTGEMIPYPVLRQFLDDALAPPYKGFAAAGFIWQPLIDPVKRRYLGIPETEEGIHVLSCMPGTGAARVLRTDDVILRWDGRRIDTLGYYEDKDFGPLNLSYLIKGRRAPGERVPVTLIREGERKDVEVELHHLSDRSALIPENVTQETPQYLVQGGLVLRALTGLYLRSHGGNWQTAVSPKLVQIYNTRRFSPSFAGEHIVILSRVLPHPINMGYQQFSDRIVEAINGQPVQGMADVFRIINADGGLERLRLDGVGVDLVLDKKALPRADRDLARNYGIPQLVHRYPEAQ